jgi:septum formation inhibitor MinC
LVQQLNSMIAELIKENRKLKRQVDKLGERGTKAASGTVERGLRTIQRRVQKALKATPKRRKRRIAAAATTRKRATTTRRRKKAG